MPTEDFLTGTVLFALMLLAVLAATGIVVQRRLAHLDRLERALAGVVVGTAVLIGVHLLPLLLGILGKATVLAAAVLAVALATRIAPRQPGPPEDRGEPPPPSGRFARATAGAAAAIALVAFLADLGRWAGDEIVGVDPLTFHLPNIGRWIQTGSLWQIDQFVPQLAHGNYPNNGDVVLLSTVLPWHNDFLVRAPICFFLLVTAVAVAAVARELKAPAAASILAAAAVVSLPIVGLATIPRALPDSLLWATYACGVLFLLRHARTSRRSDLVLAATALAIAFGTKWYGISSVGVLVAVWAGARLLHREPHALRDGLLVGGVALLGDAAWLARNLVESGNPVFPVKIAPFGVTIFDAPRDVIVEQVGFSLLDYADDPSVWGQLAGELFDGLGLLAIVCALGLLAATICNRTEREPRIALLSVAALALVPVYAWLPGTALGNPGNPELASVNTRYAVPILILLAPVTARAIGRLPKPIAVAFQLALLAAVATGAYSGYEVQGARDVVLATAGPRARRGSRLGALAHATQRHHPGRRGSGGGARAARRRLPRAAAHQRRPLPRLGPGDRRAAEGRPERQADRARRGLVRRRADADLAGVRHADRQRGRVHRLLRRLPAQVRKRGRVPGGAAPRRLRRDRRRARLLPAAAHPRAAVGDRRGLAHVRAQHAPARARAAGVMTSRASPR